MDMKSRILIVCAIALLRTEAAPTDEQLDTCGLCSDFVHLMNSGEVETVPSELEQFLDTENFEATCLDSCNINLDGVEDVDAPALDTTILLSMVGCTTCKEIVNLVSHKTYGMDYQSIKHAVNHVCSAVDGIIKTARCKLFVSKRKSQIIDAIFHYPMDPLAACLKLKQC